MTYEEKSRRSKSSSRQTNLTSSIKSNSSKKKRRPTADTNISSVRDINLGEITPYSSQGKHRDLALEKQDDLKKQASDRLNRAEISRHEHYKEGLIPLRTLRTDIDYGLDKTSASYGVTGMKVWSEAQEKIKQKEAE